MISLNAQQLLIFVPFRSKYMHDIIESTIVLLTKHEMSISQDRHLKVQPRYFNCTAHCKGLPANTGFVEVG